MQSVLYHDLPAACNLLHSLLKPSSDFLGFLFVLEIPVIHFFCSFHYQTNLSRNGAEVNTARAALIVSIC